MNKVRILKKGENIKPHTKVINLDNKYKIAFELDIDYLTKLIFTRLTFKDATVLLDYSYFDKFLEMFDEEINSIIEVAIRKNLMVLTLLSSNTVTKIDEIIDRLNNLEDLELIIFCLATDEITDKIFKLYKKI